MRWSFLGFILCFSSVLSAQAWSDSLVHFEEDTLALSFLDEKIRALKYADPQSTEVLVVMYDSIASLTEDTFYLGTAKLHHADHLYTYEKYDEALIRYVDILNYLENTSEIDLLARTNNNLGSCYQVRNDTKTSTAYFEKALELYRILNDTFWIANVNSNLGLQFLNDGYLNEAEPHFNEAIIIYDKIGNEIFKGITLLNRGNLRIQQKAYDQALSDFDISRSLIPEQVSPLINSALKAGKGSALSRLGAYNQALPLLLQSLKEAEAISHAEQKKESHKELAELYRAIGDFEKSLIHYEQYAVVKDSLFTLAQDGKLADALARYESEKKENEIALLNSKNEIQQTKLTARNRQLIIVGLSAFVLLGLLSLVGVLYKKNKDKKNIVASALDDKDTLLREIHHRVKNNLQVISALLILQSKHVDDDKAVLALQEGQGRVHSMALIHQDLYQNDNLKGVNTKEYFEKLVQNLVETYNSDSRLVKVEYDIEALLLDVDSMIPLGLVVNELTSNALKHGLRQEDVGEICISLKEHNEQLILWIKDNGPGADIENMQTKSFGYSLIRSFARRLEADLDIENNDGLSVLLRIKNYKKVA